MNCNWIFFSRKRKCGEHPVYGSCAVDRSTVGRWAKRVKASVSAETELRDLPRAGRRATANTPGMLNSADAIIPADRRITTRQLAIQLLISTGSVCSIIEKCCSSMTMHALTQAWEPGNTSPKWVGRCCPIHPTAQIWHRRTFTSLGLLKMLCVELALKMTTA
jgi:hypothetical protein